MDGSEADQVPPMHRPGAGDWAGWFQYGEEPFEDLTGPFYYHREASGRVVCAFRAAQKHMNGAGFMHGGCMLTFADYSLFCIAMNDLKGSNSVTASLNGEFVDAAELGELIEATGDVVRAGGSLVFIRGLVTASGRPILNYSGIVKKITRRDPPAG